MIALLLPVVLVLVLFGLDVLESLLFPPPAHRPVPDRGKGISGSGGATPGAQPGQPPTPFSPLSGRKRWVVRRRLRDPGKGPAQFPVPTHPLRSGPELL